MSPMLRVLGLTAAGMLLMLAALLGIGWQVQQARESAWQAQLDSYLLGHLRATVEDYLATGLQLEQMEALQDVIERDKSAFARIVAIDVFSPRGTVLYSTDTDSRGQHAPDSWRQHLAQAASWRSELPEQRQIGQRFDNDLGQAAGGIVVTLSTATPTPSLVQWKAWALTAAQWLAVAALALLAAAGAVHAGLRRLLRPYDEAARILRGGDSTADGELTQAAQRQHQHWALQDQQRAQARRELEALDGEL